VSAKRILIIDDDVEFCEELTESLRAEGHEPFYSSDPSMGSEMIRSGEFDIVLLDYKMQGLTGLDVLRDLRNDGIGGRIFMISGRCNLERDLEQEGLLDMVEGVMSKPPDFEDLLSKIE
jgi:two-component system, OmpR family, manganese sensing response regulator